VAGLAALVLGGAHTLLTGLAVAWLVGSALWRRAGAGWPAAVGGPR
jgi:hypothetical protein